MILWMLVAIVVVPVYRTISSGDSISFLLPNLLLFTPYRELAKTMWSERIHVNMNVKRLPLHIATIEAEDYTFENMRVATENFRFPAVVRGFFNGTVAMEKWADPEYLNSRIGDFVIPVVRAATYGTPQNDRVSMTFREAFSEVADGNQKSKMYLFFPVESRTQFNHSDLGTSQKLKEEVNKVVLEDLDLSRIWKGFGTKNHKNYHGSQFVIGRGSSDSGETTGTGWHCAAGNNWFAQVIGNKRWYFMDPKHSSYLSPLRGGKVNMMTGNRRMWDYQEHIPMRYADIHAGDLLYNPDWEWHTIKNYEGLAFGVPIREFNVSLSLRNNLQYTSIVLINKILDKFKIDIGGYSVA